MGKGTIRAVLFAIFAVLALPTMTAQGIQSVSTYIKGE